MGLKIMREWMVNIHFSDENTCKLFFFESYGGMDVPNLKGTL